jgi:DNA-binding XRE family transcriptional regulator
VHWTPDDWARLGKALKAARRARMLTQPQVAARTDLSPQTVKDIEAGHEYRKVTRSIRAFAVVVGWTGGSPELVLDGNEPTQIHDAPEPDPSSAPPLGSVSIPADLYAALVRIAAHVSAGRAAVFVQGPYPDAVARRTLEALEDAGLLDQFRPADAT